MSNSQAPATMSVVVRTFDDTHRAEVTVPAEMTVCELLKAAKQRWRLSPERDYQITRTERRFDACEQHRDSEIEMDEDQSLWNAGVRPGQLITIYPLLVAGGGDAVSEIRRRRLGVESEALRRVAEALGSALAVAETEGEPPHTYELELKCRGVRSVHDGKPIYGLSHRVRITYPRAFPLPGSLPHVAFLTPIQHVHVYENGKVCLGVVSGSDEPLDALVLRLFRLIQHDPLLIDTSSAANGAMVDWTEDNRHRFPLGRVGFSKQVKRKTPLKWVDQ